MGWGCGRIPQRSNSRATHGQCKIENRERRAEERFAYRKAKRQKSQEGDDGDPVEINHHEARNTKQSQAFKNEDFLILVQGRLVWNYLSCQQNLQTLVNRDYLKIRIQDQTPSPFDIFVNTSHSLYSYINLLFTIIEIDHKNLLRPTTCFARIESSRG